MSIAKEAGYPTGFVDIAGKGRYRRNDARGPVWPKGPGIARS